MQDKHYSNKAQDLSYDEQVNLLRKSFELKKYWWFDKLDCRESYHRKRIDVSFDEAMSHFKTNSAISVIKRNDLFDGEHYEVGFRSLEMPVDYFLWIQIPIEKEQEIMAMLK